ncbi:hypothetical protein [Virgibacillus halodenitrificans]|uniref:hypothetical protein n=1 Tax=Virgibacillus halodenitrificans TaxID=1482 RepID=UPI00037A2F85|nr:hypothetical protein [Virgibacillus halodenitrificans]
MSGHGPGRLGLMIDIHFCKLPSCDNDIFSLESYNSILFDDVPRNNTIKFYISHSEADLFIEKLGVENTFIFHRVMLSFYNAAYKLYNFSRLALPTDEDISIATIESKIKNYNITDFNYHSISYANFLTYSETGRGIERINANKNEIQELIWSMNLKSILNNYSIPFFTNLNPTKSFKLSEFDYIVNKILQDRELSMVMHTWGKLNNYNRPDFINIVSNILEFIEQDVKRNKEKFIHKRSDYKQEYVLLDRWLNLVTKNPTRKKFFGIFNSANLFGFLSRHGSKSLADYTKLNVSHEKIACSFDDIIQRMENKTIPNQDELRYIFNFWHYTTSNIVSLWFRLRQSL